jgi:opacity protein-like surface antigen
MSIGGKRACVFLYMSVALAVLFMPSAWAGEGKTYLKLEGGPSWISDVSAKEFQGVYLNYDSAKFKLNAGSRFDLVFGINVNRAFAIELETGVFHNSFDSVYGINDRGRSYSSSLSGTDFWQVPILVNGVFTLLPESKMHPFAGIGLGALASITPTQIDSDSYTAAFQLQLGGRYDVTEMLDLGLSYKYLAAFRQKRFLEDFTVDYVGNNTLAASLTIHF